MDRAAAKHTIDIITQEIIERFKRSVSVWLNKLGDKIYLLFFAHSTSQSMDSEHYLPSTQLCLPG